MKVPNRSREDLKKPVSIRNGELEFGVGQWFAAQLAERSLPIPKVRGSNPVIGKFIYYQLH